MPLIAVRRKVRSSKGKVSRSPRSSIAPHRSVRLSSASMASARSMYAARDFGSLRRRSHTSSTMGLASIGACGTPFRVSGKATGKSNRNSLNSTKRHSSSAKADHVLPRVFRFRPKVARRKSRASCTQPSWPFSASVWLVPGARSAARISRPDSTRRVARNWGQLTPPPIASITAKVGPAGDPENTWRISVA